jgi:hypothetical protein
VAADQQPSFQERVLTAGGENPVALAVSFLQAGEIATHDLTQGRRERRSHAAIEDLQLNRGSAMRVNLDVQFRRRRDVDRFFLPENRACGKAQKDNTGCAQNGPVRQISTFPREL